MPDEKCDTEVLVVGAGPTGLMLAHELRCRGIGIRIVDVNPDQVHESRALVVHARTLELLRQARPGGAAGGARAPHPRRLDPRREEARPQDRTRGHRHRSGTTLPDFILFVSQAGAEKLLSDALSRRGTQVERGTRLDSVAVTDDCVLATVSSERRDGGRTAVEQVRARFLVGCDGAHSVVRKRLGWVLRRTLRARIHSRRRGPRGKPHGRTDSTSFSPERAYSPRSPLPSAVSFALSGRVRRNVPTTLRRTRRSPHATSRRSRTISPPSRFASRNYGGVRVTACIIAPRTTSRKTAHSWRAMPRTFTAPPAGEA